MMPDERNTPSEPEEAPDPNATSVTPEGPDAKGEAEAPDPAPAPEEVPGEAETPNETPVTDEQASKPVEGAESLPSESQNEGSSGQ